MLAHIARVGPADLHDATGNRRIGETSCIGGGHRIAKCQRRERVPPR